MMMEALKFLFSGTVVISCLIKIFMSCHHFNMNPLYPVKYVSSG